MYEETESKLYQGEQRSPKKNKKALELSKKSSSGQNQSSMEALQQIMANSFNASVSCTQILDKPWKDCPKDSVIDLMQREGNNIMLLCKQVKNVFIRWNGGDEKIKEYNRNKIKIHYNTQIEDLQPPRTVD